MTIDDLRKILAVIEAGSINKAADSLFIAQPALSRCIKRIEDEYNIELFERTKGKRIVLTPEGEIFVRASREILLIHDGMTSELDKRRARDDSRIIFGTATQQAVDLFGRMLRWFYANAPQYRLETRSGGTGALHNDVLRGEIDTALINVYQFKESLYYEKNRKIVTILYTARNSGLLDKAEERDGCLYPVIGINDLKDEKFVVNRRGTASREAFDKLTAKHGINPETIEESNMYQRMRIADEGVYHYILSAAGNTEMMFGGDPDRYLQLAPEDDIESWRYLVCRKGFEKSERFRLLSECLRTG